MSTRNYLQIFIMYRCYLPETFLKALDVACFEMYEHRLRFFIGSRSACNSLQSDSLSELLKLLVPKSDSDLGLERAVSQYCTASQRLRGDHVSILRKVYLSTDLELLKNLKSEDFSEFTRQLREIQLSDAQQNILRSIVQFVGLTPETPGRGRKNKLMSNECPLVFDQVFETPLFLISYITPVVGFEAY